MVREKSKTHGHRIVLVLLGAFVLRLGIRLARGESSFWGRGYEVYYMLASNLLRGDTLCLDVNGIKCAYWPPIYPLFLALAMLVEDSYLPIVVLQSLVSVGTVLCVFLLGKELFGTHVGMLASIFAGLYPYYFWHDTSLQDTSLFTFLTVLSMWLYYRAKQTRSTPTFGLAGAALGLAVLTKATLIPFLVVLLPGMVMFESTSLPLRLRWTVAVLVSFMLTISPWIVRNYLVVGAPVITTVSGRQLWIANNPHTFSHYPEGRIDFDEVDAWDGLTSIELEQVTSLSGDELAQEAWFMQRGLDSVANDPVLTMRRALFKVVTVFSWKFSPAKDFVFQTVYFSSYSPVLVFGLVGMFIERKRWRNYLPIYSLFLGFSAGTAVFHAHTSHRAYLDVYFMIFSAHVIILGISRWSRRGLLGWQGGRVV